MVKLVNWFNDRRAIIKYEWRQTKGSNKSQTYVRLDNMISFY